LVVAAVGILGRERSNLAAAPCVLDHPGLILWLQKLWPQVVYGPDSDGDLCVPSPHPFADKSVTFLAPAEETEFRRYKHVVRATDLGKPRPLHRDAKVTVGTGNNLRPKFLRPKYEARVVKDALKSLWSRPGIQTAAITSPAPTFNREPTWLSAFINLCNCVPELFVQSG
jgi:hypothetical protein